MVESHNKLPIQKMGSLKLFINQINYLKLLQKNVKADIDFLQNRDLLSEEMIDMKRKEIKEKMEKEMTEGETANQAFRVNNPLKTLNNSVSKIEDAKNQLEIAGKFFRESGWFYNIHTISNLQAILDIPKGLLQNLLTQVNNVER